MTEPQKLSPFQQALLDSVLDDYKGELGGDGEQHKFSEEFECWFWDFCRNNTARRVRVRGILRKVLIAAVIIALLVGTVLAIPAVREALIAFFTHDQIDGIAITFDSKQAETAPHTISLPYQVTYIPEEYELVIDEVNITCIAQCWRNQLGQRITFIQYTLPDSDSDDYDLTIDAYNNSKESVILEGYLVKIIDTGRSRRLIWTNNAYFFTLELPMSVTDEEMELIFASWGPKE